MSNYEGQPRFYIRNMETGETIKLLPKNLRVNQFNEVEQLKFKQLEYYWIVNKDFQYIEIFWD